MARLAPKTDVLRALFMRSGNQCAFPGCTQPLVNDKNKFIAQVCHIEAASEGGERFNPDGNDEHRRSYENLLILCYPHHIETNDVEEYPVDRLLCIKREQDTNSFTSNFGLDAGSGTSAYNTWPPGLSTLIFRCLHIMADRSSFSGRLVSLVHAGMASLHPAGLGSSLRAGGGRETKNEALF